jgi:MFS family permease
MQSYGGNKRKDRRRWPVLVLLCAVEFVVVGAIAVVAIALPSIGEDLGFSWSELQWVISAYVLAFGGFLLPAGRAADLWGRRRVFVVGLGLFSVAFVAVFISIEAMVKHPLVPLGVFRSRDLVGSGLVALAFQATTNAPLLLCILYLQEVAGLPPAEAGFAFVPFAAARTDSLAGDLAHPPDVALVEGYRWAFYAGAALAVLGALTALALIRSRRR